MCGIIGYMGEQNANQFVLDGLKELVYRGYDSWGIAYTNSGKIKCLKVVGDVTDSARLQHSSYCAIGHTRWATHGTVTRNNAHPHLSNDNHTAVVHNGIIENHSEIKEQLEQKGYKFTSETDSEIIPLLFEDLVKTHTPIEAAKILVNRLKGKYSFLAMHQNQFFGLNNGCPLLVGKSSCGYFIASDVQAFLKHTKQMAFLKENEMVVIKKDKVQFINNTSGICFNKDYSHINFSAEATSLNSYPHYMLKEIEEQPQSLHRMISEISLKETLNMINKCSKIIITGCGTSYHVALHAADMLLYSTGKPVIPVIASEFSQISPTLNDKTLFIAISQSGETADTLEALSFAKKKCCQTMSVINSEHSSMSRFAGNHLYMRAGPEKAVAATKTYTNSLAIFMLLEQAIQNKNLLHSEDIRDIIRKTIIKSKPKMQKLANELKDKRHLFILGRGNDYYTALEGALKMKEISYIHAEGFAGGELKHGTMALIEKGTPVIVLTNYASFEKTVGNAQEVKARGAKIIGVSPRTHEAFDRNIHTPHIYDRLTKSVLLQLLAYYVSVAKNLNPDKPRNLAKSVTVT